MKFIIKFLDEVRCFLTWSPGKQTADSFMIHSTTNHTNTQNVRSAGNAYHMTSWGCQRSRLAMAIDLEKLSKELQEHIDSLSDEELLQELIKCGLKLEESE